MTFWGNTQWHHKETIFVHTKWAIRLIKHNNGKFRNIIHHSRILSDVHWQSLEDYKYLWPHSSSTILPLKKNFKIYIYIYIFFFGGETYSFSKNSSPYVIPSAYWIFLKWSTPCQLVQTNLIKWTMRSKINKRKIQRQTCSNMRIRSRP